MENVPGWPGVGPKQGSVLMQTFTELDHLYESVDRVADLKLRGAAQLGDRLARHRADAYLAQQLTHIYCTMPLDLDRHALRRRVPDRAALTQFYDQQGFGSMLRQQAERLISAHGKG